jgi:hypothetical protein
MDKEKYQELNDSLGKVQATLKQRDLSIEQRRNFDYLQQS